MKSLLLTLTASTMLMSSTAFASDMILTKDEIAYLENYIQGLRNQVTELSNQVSTLEGAVEDLNDRALVAESALATSLQEAQELSAQNVILNENLGTCTAENEVLAIKVETVEGLINDEVADRMKMVKDVIENLE